MVSGLTNILGVNASKNLYVTLGIKTKDERQFIRTNNY